MEIYRHTISDDGVKAMLTVIHLISYDWSNSSAWLSLFSLLDLLLPWWMRAWFGYSVCVCVGVSFQLLVCVYPLPQKAYMLSVYLCSLRECICLFDLYVEGKCVCVCVCSFLRDPLSYKWDVCFLNLSVLNLHDDWYCLNTHSYTHKVQPAHHVHWKQYFNDK